MGIKQEKRLDAPHVEVKDTDYGAQFVKAATETKIALPEEEEKKSEEQLPSEEDVQPAAKPRKKGGRPKKAKG